ncbi:phage regulatory CII family protein [Nitratidesulfovibrio vulgaris]|uniref:Uncharacterized protein n=1 Tax=Nitratidesulfovibrio vulgaris (strain DP4) TaxID=391774 RepID=A0A0H3ABT7_NITV4|nr:phage regulatory CII family protein [Nitratidesulfovibrio vulgaris]ABM29789.1 hypothetical protein Dvul_2778 [Nitratidesulfovibrio vulgaris DP4]
MHNALHHLDAVDAFKLAVEQSNRPVTEIAAELGWSESFMRRVFSTEKFFPSFADLPAFCAAVGNLTILHWLLARATFYGIDEKRQSVDCRSLLERVNSVFAEVGDVAHEARRAIADDRIDKAERHRLIGELSDVLEGCMALIADLREMDAHA